MAIKLRVTICAAGLFCVTFSLAHAERIHVVKRLDGYACIGLDIPDSVKTPMDLPPVYERPSSQSVVITKGEASMVAPVPLRQQNGFVQIVLPNQRAGWVAAGLVQPWHNVMFPSTRCFPAVMSDGSWAFDYQQ